MKDETLASKDIVLAISSMGRQAKMLLNRGKEYDNLLIEILKYNYYDEENHSLPSIKELGLKLSMNYTKIKNLLKQIYDDIGELAWKDSTAFTLSEIEYDFFIECYENRVSFKGFLPVCPRVGETVNFPFFRPRTHEMDFYYVSRVIHELTDNKQTITIWLKCGIYNSYEQFKKDKDEIEAEEQHKKYLAAIDYYKK